MKNIDVAVAVLVLVGCAESTAATPGSDGGGQLPQQVQDASEFEASSDSEVASDSDVGTDSGDPWQCSGSHGARLTCDSFGARPLKVSRYDADQACFEPVIELPGLCAVPVYCPGGSGAAMCIVDENGDAYVTVVLWGEEIAEGWHHGVGADLDSSLTADEERACDAIRNRVRIDDPDAGAVQLRDGAGELTALQPVCAD